ncbi:hypothetical protein D3C76_1120910 [compost metagenome]
MVLGVDVVVVLVQNVRVFHIGRRTFQAVQAQQTQAEDILANRRFVFVRDKFSRLTLQVAEIVAHQLQIGHGIIDAGTGINVQGLGFQGVTQGNSFTGVAHNAWRIEVDVGQGREKRTRGEVIHVVVDNAIFPGFYCPGG